jgi:hypothetical protein
MFSVLYKARICQRLKSPGIGSKEPIPRNRFHKPIVAWRAGTITLFVVLAHQAK